MKILNFHDLGESGENACYNELLKYWSSRQIVSQTYDLAGKDPAAILLDSMVMGPYDLIVGTGFGAVLALLAGRATGVRTVLVNPMYPIQRYLPSELPDYEFGDTLTQCEHGAICWDTKRESLKNVFLILGRDDDITDTARTPAYFYRGNSRFVEGGHVPSGDDFAQAFGELTGGVEKEEEEPENDGSGRHGGIVVSMKMVRTDSEPELERAEDIRVDEVDTSNGHIVIFWSYPDEEPRRHALYLYYANGGWHRDEEDGFAFGEKTAATILRNASDQIIAQTDCTKHDAQDFWGWGW